MKIKLIEYKVVDLSLQTSFENAGNNDFKLGTGNIYPDGNNQIFGVGFKADFCQQGYSMHIEMRFFFETDSVITEEFKKSSFPTVNAPAIAFPYFRSFISILTMQAGYQPIMIPSLNFVELAKRTSEN